MLSRTTPAAAHWWPVWVGMVLAAGLAYQDANAQSKPLGDAEVTLSPGDQIQRRVLEARKNGYWIVEEGEHLYRICRYFYAEDRIAIERLRDYLLKRNTHAFLNGKAGLLVVGAKLHLPPELVFASQPSLRAPSPPASQSPAVATPAQPPVARQPAEETSTAQSATATQPASPTASPSQPKPPSSPDTAPYADKLIEGVVEEESTSQAELNQTPGSRTLAIDLRAESHQRASGGRSTEQGIDLRYRWETVNYGDFYLDAGLRSLTPASGDLVTGNRRGGRFTLYQNRFPLGESWIADSALGTLRTPPNPLINSSYRIFLPTSLIEGVSSVVSNPTQEFRFALGRLGRLDGSFGQSFDTTAGRLFSLGYNQRLGSGWLVGGEVVGLRGNPLAADHESLSLAAEYRQSLQGGHKVQLVTDSEARYGAWYDGDVVAGRTRYRFGLFQLDPALAWGDGAIVNDTRGAYLRTDHRALSYTVSAGADVAENNIRDDPAHAKSESASVYGSFTLRLDRTLSVGAGVTYQDTHTRFSASPDSKTLSGNAFLTWTNDLGITRFDVAHYLLRPVQNPDTTIDTFSWSQEWPTLSDISVSTTLNHSRERIPGNPTTRTSLGFSLRGPLAGALTWDAGLVFARVETPLGAEENANATAGASWNFARDWNAQAQLSWNTIDPAPTLPGVTAQPFQREKRFMLGVRYEATSGVPYQALGLKPGGGSGRISGVVFFDENDDGVRQPTERGAANITLYLDGRLPATTSSDGRFSFPIVTPGSHRLRVLNENLPLPWTLDDERQLAVTVPLRGESVIDIPLTRIKP